MPKALPDRIILSCRKGTSDKIYHAEIVPKAGGYLVNFAFGRRGARLQAGTKTPSPVPKPKARAIYEAIVREKMAKGYAPDKDAAAPATDSERLATLRKMSSASAARCKAALKAANGDLDKALRSLIASDHVGVNDLDAELTTDLHYALIETRRLLALCEQDPALRPPVLKATRAASVADLRKRLTGEADIDRNTRLNGADERLRALHRRFPRKRYDNDYPRRVVIVPPLPPLAGEIGEWEGHDVLPAWAGFQARGGPYTSRNSARPSTGKVAVTVNGPSHKVADPPPAPEQAAAYRYLKEHGAQITDAIVTAVFKKYPEIRKRYLIDAEDDDDVPVITDKSQLRNLIGVGIVHVMELAKAGQAYIGFECGCTWDEEHGLGIMTHKNRVVAIGDADTGFDFYAAKDDGGKPIKA